MANAFGGSIEAVLSLNAQPFNNSINSSISAVEKLVTNLNKLSSSSATTGINQTNEALINLKNSLEAVSQINNKAVNTFNKLANAIHKMSLGFQILNSDTVNVEQATNTMNNIFKAFQGVLSSTYVKVDKLSGSYSRLDAEEQKQITRQQQIQQALANQRNSWVASEQALLKMGASINQNIAEQERLKQALAGVKSAIITKKVSVEESLATLNRNRTAVMNLITGNNQLSASEEKVSASTTKATASTQRQAVANRTATASTNQLTTATSRLGKAMSSLRMMGSLVGSMLAYNFAHKLLVATGETIHAKSEMEGYFKMLNFGQRDIDGFNRALDKTVAQFQRVNKYSLGETISSIGVEFNLSTKEMEKAMKVTSMITSEYLRAGRNANEASLAVKDVLQGQFQRLSRETGVKGEQLKDAGWSGDTTDVLGLMEALEKVGKSRNWDVFAEKANSLNDILTITQNRFGEWSADMVYSVQPMIVGAFNMIMGTAQKFASVISGVWEWLNNDSLESNIAKWTALGGAITTVLGILVAYRTGAGLLQVAQLGLTRTIASTVLGLNAEQVALYGTRSAIFAKIFGLEAEKVATLSVRDAILSKILGLDAELVAQSSLRQGILDKAFAQELETLRLKGATTEEMLNTLALYENQLAQKSSIGLLTAQALGLNMTTYATHGFTVALLEANTGMKASQIASMGLAKKIALLGVSIGVPTAIVGAFAIALLALAKQMYDSAKAMEKFNNLVKNGDNIIKEAKSTVEEYTKRQESLKQKLSEAKEGTVEYYEAQNKLRDANSQLIGANKELENSIKAVELAKSAQSKYEQKMTDMNIQHQNALAKAYMDAGYSAVEAYEMSSDALLEAKEGAEQLRVTLQKIARLHYKGEQNVSYMLSQFSANGVDKDVQKPYLEKAESLNEKMAKAMEKGLTDESFMGRLDGWLSYYQYQIENWFNNIGAMLETGDWYKVWDNVWRGIAHGFADLPIFKDFWGWVFKETGIDQLKGAGWDFFEWFGDPSKDFFSWVGESIANIVNGIGDLFKPLTDLFSGDGFSTMMKIDTTWIANIAMIIVNAIKNFDWMGALSGLADTFGISNLVSAIFGVVEGMDTSWAWEWLNNNIVTPLQTQLGMFLADPLSYVGGMIMSTGIGGLINALIPDDGGVSILNYVNTSIIQPFTQGIQMGIASIPILGDIAQMLGLVPQQNENARQTGYNLLDHLKQGVEQKIREIPIIGDIAQMLGLIPQQNNNARDKGHGIGDNIKQGEKQGQQGTAQNVASEMNDVITAISGAINDAFASAQKVGSAIWDGINSVLKRASPGFIHDEVLAEFGTDIPNAIESSGATAYSVAQGYAQNIKQGIADTGTTTIGMDGMVADYETDAQMIAQSSQLMGTTTTTAFNDMSMAVNSSTSQMGTNVANTYTSIGTKQATLLNNMKTKNTTAYNEMYQKSNQSLLQMRDSTSNITNQMTNAWNHMKNNIVASANRLKSESTSHFNQLSNTIGSFYRKIQNPSSWGSAGSPHGGSSRRNTRVGRAFSSTIRKGGYAGGSGHRWGSSNTMTISALKHKLFPSGTGYGDMFDGFKGTDVVDVSQFLSLMIEDGHGFGGWNYSNSHYNYIKTKSDQWGMKSPTINLAGGIPTNADYKVGDFENGSPKISFSSFQSMAESIFTAIPYRFYYDSDWKGSWLGALQAGACNCWDGAHALLAFAQSCGFSGGIQHGTWVDPDGTSYPHVYAVINGKKMDTTGWQQRRSWSAGSPNVGASSPKNGNSQPPKVEVTINFNEPVYGVDELDSRIEEGIDKGLQKHFNDPYTIAI